MTEEQNMPKVEAALIVEVLGKPPEHLISTLEDIIKQISEEKGVRLINKKIHEPKELEKKPDFFTSFAEVEIQVDNPFLLSALMFKYMPAHVELISPEHLNLTNKHFNEMLNELTRRLHGYDEVARILQAENQLMKQKLQQLLPPQQQGQHQGQQSAMPQPKIEMAPQEEKPKKKTSKKKSSKKKSKKK